MRGASRIVAVAALVVALAPARGHAQDAPSEEDDGAGYDDWNLGSVFDEDAAVEEDAFDDPLREVEEATLQQIRDQEELDRIRREGVARREREQAEVDALLDAFTPDADLIARAHRAVDQPPWRVDEPDGFFSGHVDVGVAFLRPRLSFGWGQPHHKWIGVDANPILSPGGAGFYGGFRLDLDWLDFRAGARYFYSFRRSFLEPRDHFDSQDIQIRAQANAAVLSYETELTLEIPAGPGWIALEGSYTFVTGVPDDLFVFEERLHTILDPPHVWRARWGYQMPVGITGVPRVAAVMEVQGNPARDVLVWRAGLLAKVQLFSDLEMRVTFLPPIRSPDRIGIVAGEFGFGLRYRWAHVF